MAQKKISLPDIGEVTLQKRRGNRSIRLTVGHSGEVKVSMPTWTPYHLGEAFARSKTAWIVKHRAGKQPNVLGPGDRVGKGHRLQFIPEQRSAVATRVSQTAITVRLPLGKNPLDGDVQKAVQAAAVRALKQEAKAALPRRLNELARLHGFKYRSVAIKQLKTRWGSCSTHADIALNCYLMQLPWELIDYVLLHELVHTRIMAHGKPFWDELSHYVDSLAAKRKTIRDHRPTLIPQL